MSKRTQIYLSDEQRARLSEMANRPAIPMAEVVRRALDAYIDVDGGVDATFGAAPGLASSVPSAAVSGHAVKCFCPINKQLPADEMTRQLADCRAAPPGDTVARSTRPAASRTVSS